VLPFEVMHIMLQNEKVCRQTKGKNVTVSEGDRGLNQVENENFV